MSARALDEGHLAGGLQRSERKQQINEDRQNTHALQQRIDGFYCVLTVSATLHPPSTSSASHPTQTHKTEGLSDAESERSHPSSASSVDPSAGATSKVSRSSARRPSSDSDSNSDGSSSESDGDNRTSSDDDSDKSSGSGSGSDEVLTASHSREPDSHESPSPMSAVTPQQHSGTDIARAKLSRFRTMGLVTGSAAAVPSASSSSNLGSRRHSVPSVPKKHRPKKKKKRPSLNKAPPPPTPDMTFVVSKYGAIFGSNPRILPRFMALPVIPPSAQAAKAASSSSSSSSAAAAAAAVAVMTPAPAPAAPLSPTSNPPPRNDAAQVLQPIADVFVSRSHFQIEEHNGVFYLRDCGSLNGTYLRKFRYDLDVEHHLHGRSSQRKASVNSAHSPVASSVASSASSLDPAPRTTANAPTPTATSAPGHPPPSEPSASGISPDSLLLRAGDRLLLGTTEVVVTSVTDGASLLLPATPSTAVVGAAGSNQSPQQQQQQQPQHSQHSLPKRAASLIRPAHSAPRSTRMSVTSINSSISAGTTQDTTLHTVSHGAAVDPLSPMPTTSESPVPSSPSAGSPEVAPATAAATDATPLSLASTAIPSVASLVANFNNLSVNTSSSPRLSAGRRPSSIITSRIGLEKRLSLSVSNNNKGTLPMGVNLKTVTGTSPESVLLAEPAPVGIGDRERPPPSALNLSGQAFEEEPISLEPDPESTFGVTLDFSSGGQRCSVEVGTRGGVIGKEPSCLVFINDRALRDQHARIVYCRADRRFYLQDILPSQTISASASPPPPSSSSSSLPSPAHSPHRDDAASVSGPTPFCGFLARLSPSSIASRPFRLDTGDVLRIGHTEFRVDILSLPAKSHRPRRSRRMSRMPSTSDGVETPNRHSPTALAAGLSNFNVSFSRTIGLSSECVSLFCPAHGVSSPAPWTAATPSPACLPSVASVSPSLTHSSHVAVTDKMESLTQLPSSGVIATVTPSTAAAAPTPTTLSNHEITPNAATERPLLDIGVATDANWKYMEEMQDRCAVVPDLGGPLNALVAVYDGHGTRLVADFLATSLHQSLVAELSRAKHQQLKLLGSRTTSASQSQSVPSTVLPSQSQGPSVPSAVAAPNPLSPETPHTPTVVSQRARLTDSLFSPPHASDSEDGRSDSLSPHHPGGTSSLLSAFDAPTTDSHSGDSVSPKPTPSRPSLMSLFTPPSSSSLSSSQTGPPTSPPRASSPPTLSTAAHVTTSATTNTNVPLANAVSSGSPAHSTASLTPHQQSARPQSLQTSLNASPPLPTSAFSPLGAGAVLFPRHPAEPVHTLAHAPEYSDHLNYTELLHYLHRDVDVAVTLEQVTAANPSPMHAGDAQSGLATIPSHPPSTVSFQLRRLLYELQYLQQNYHDLQLNVAECLRRAYYRTAIQVQGLGETSKYGGSTAVTCLLHASTLSPPPVIVPSGPAAASESSTTSHDAPSLRALRSRAWLRSVQRLFEDSRPLSSAPHIAGLSAVARVNLKLYTANVGDSRAVLCRQGIAVPLTVDHKPSSKEEQKRVAQVKGRIHNGRLGGCLDVTRAFGDLGMVHFGLSCEPHLTEHTLYAGDTAVVLASDGLWDFVSESEVARLLQQPEHASLSATEQAQMLVRLALSRRTHDNISVIVVKLHPLLQLLLPPPPVAHVPIAGLPPLAADSSVFASRQLSSITEAASSLERGSPPVRQASSLSVTSLSSLASFAAVQPVSSSASSAAAAAAAVTVVAGGSVSPRGYTAASPPPEAPMHGAGSHLMSLFAPLHESSM